MKKWAIYIIVIYIILAFTWWTILLLKRNKEITNFKIELKKESTEQILATSRKQNLMIVSEGLVFGISLLIGVVLIFRAFKKELQLSRNQNNFLLSVSHELKSPLTSIKLSLETIKKRKFEVEKILEVNEIAYKESERLEKLIEELLMTTKIESGYSYKFESVNLSEIVENIISTFRYSNDNIEFLYQKEEKDIFVIADKLLLRSAIVNLIENAVKYGNTLPVMIELKNDLNQSVLSIADNGNGITDLEKKNIFNKFYRIGNEDTRSSKGVGLGLYLVKLIIDVHKGNISVKSNKPSGSIFIVKLNSISK